MKDGRGYSGPTDHEIRDNALNNARRGNTLSLDEYLYPWVHRIEGQMMGQGIFYVSHSDLDDAEKVEEFGGQKMPEGTIEVTFKILCSPDGTAGPITTIYDEQRTAEQVMRSARESENYLAERYLPVAYMRQDAWKCRLRIDFGDVQRDLHIDGKHDYVARYVLNINRWIYDFIRAGGPHTESEIVQAVMGALNNGTLVPAQMGD